MTIPTTIKPADVDPVDTGSENELPGYVHYDEPVYAKLPDFPTTPAVTEAQIRPDYYSIPGLGITANDIIEALDMRFAMGCVMKYIIRAGRKPDESELKDLMKAREYLDRRISQLKE